MKIFLSYADEADEQTARLIALALRARGHNVWYEVDGISGGANWQNETKTIIKGSDWMIALISPAYVNSQPATWELFNAIQSQIAILPIFIRSTNLRPTSLAFLERIHHIDISQNIEEGIRGVIEYLDAQNQDTQNKRSSSIENQIPENIESLIQVPPPDRVFIAYSRKQQNIAKRLHELLVANGKAVFWDAKIKAGATWRQTIQKALDDATHVVVIWTSDAALSDEVEREVSYALAERKVIVPILSKEIPRLPYHLHGLHYIVLEDDIAQIEQPLLKAIEQFSANEDIWQ